MKTVIENKAGINQEHVYGNIEIPCIYENESYNRSCFYDFGVRQPAKFWGHSNEKESKFVKSLESYFFD